MVKYNIWTNSSILLVFFLLTILIFPSSKLTPPCWGENAMVLPKGIWMASIGFNIYPPWDEKFTNTGHTRPLATYYNLELNAQNLGLKPQESMLQLLDPNFQLIMGKSIVSFEKKAVITNIVINYGLTEKLSFGIKIPYWNFKTKVKAALDNRTSTVVRNPKFDPSGAYKDLQFPQHLNFLNNVEYIPKGILEYLNLSNQIQKFELTTEDIINFLIEQYGYKRFETWQGDDIGDIEAGVKYQYFNNGKWRLAFQTGVLFPTGREDDPDNLIDYAFGSGTYGLSFGLQNDYLKLKDLTISGSINYTIHLSDKENLRVPPSVDNPITKEKRDVDRDLGDILELEFSGIYKLTNCFKLSIVYGIFIKEKDSMKVAGIPAPSLEDETRQQGHTFLLGFTYDNLLKYKEKTARIPFQTSFSLFERFAGENMNKSKYFSIKSGIFF